LASPFVPQTGHRATALPVAAVEAISRLIHSPKVDGGPIIAVAVAGIIVNVAASWVLARTNRADAIASLVVVALMVKAAWEVLRDSGRILLEAAPEGLELQQIRTHLTEVPHVLAVHDLHAWTVTLSSVG
jgi:cobalt-zinc-cadmium efflux system protein